MLSSAVLVLTAAMVVGQADAQSNSERLNGFEWLIGSWTASSVITTDIPELGMKKGDQQNGQISWRWMLKKNIIVADWRSQTGGTVRQGHEIIAWDPKSEQYVHSAFTAEGIVASGVWHQEGDCWIGKWSGNGPGGLLVAGTVTLQKTDADKYTWKVNDVQIGETKIAEIPVVEYTRSTDQTKKSGGSPKSRRSS